MSRPPSHRNIEEFLSDHTGFLSASEAALTSVKASDEPDDTTLIIKIMLCDLSLGDGGKWVTALSSAVDLEGANAELLAEHLITKCAEAMQDSAFEFGRVRLLFVHSRETIASKQYTIANEYTADDGGLAKMREQEIAHLGQLQAFSRAYAESAQVTASLLREIRGQSTMLAGFARDAHETTAKLIASHGGIKVGDSVGKAVGSLVSLITKDPELGKTAADTAKTAFNTVVQAANQQQPPQGTAFTVTQPDGTKRPATEAEIRAAGYDPATGDRLKADTAAVSAAPNMTEAEAEAMFRKFTQDNPDGAKRIAKGLIKDNLIPGVAPMVADML